jgi:MFS transporter, DHA1 family, tetracycline resistance protein
MPVSRITQAGFTTKELGALYTYEALFYAISCGLLIRPVVKRFGQERCLFMALFSLSIFVALLLFDKSPKMLWIYIPLQQFMLGIFNTTVTTLVSNRTHPSVQGEMLGIQTSIQSLAFVSAPLIGGFLISLHMNLPLILGAVTLFIGAITVSIPKKLFSKSS